MATIEYWIQLENHAWDVCPNNIDRITGQLLQANPANLPDTTLVSPVTGKSRKLKMFKPLSEDALILRRYTENWAAPDDRKVNPWDQNEHDPTDAGTMGTIPGPVIECNIGDKVIVHYRNMDSRGSIQIIDVPIHIPGDGTINFPIPTFVPFPVDKRTHSLHPHGFVFAPTSDGAYPLSPPDPTQPVGAEAALWASAGVTGFKQGDRIPPGGTYDYLWETRGWPSTAGVWLYHDHSICTDESVQQGAIGLIVIHNPKDPQDVITPDLPEGSPVGSPIQLFCFPFPFEVPAFPTDLSGLGSAELLSPGHEMTAMSEGNERRIKATRKPPVDEGPPIAARIIKHGDTLFELDEQLQKFTGLCFPFYISPPNKAQYLLLFHTLGNAGMCINGRKFLGNTPTVIAGPKTLMRFGVVGMISDFHTFHLHGHRWVIPGPDGTDPNTIQNSPQIRAVSQFEDTRTFGPANSFSFTIQQDERSFFGAFPGTAIGEWHMHCHVQAHMMDGMMGSLKIINGGELALFLPVGKPCPPTPGTGGTPPPGTVQVSIIDNAFSPANAMITSGQTVKWTNNGSSPHTVTSNPGTLGCSPSSTEPFASPTLSSGNTFTHTFGASGTFAYHCEVHGCGMAGTVTVM